MARSFKSAEYMGAAIGTGIGGVIGVAIVNTAQNKANDHDPKKMKYNWQAFDMCMEGKGYKGQR